MKRTASRIRSGFRFRIVAAVLVLPFLLPAPPAAEANDRTSLVDLFDALDGENWRTKTNWPLAGFPEQPIGTWFGVTTEDIGGDQRVTELELPGNNLDGRLPGGDQAELGGLTELKVLNLSRNQKLLGSLPTTASIFRKLRELDLSHTGMSGSIPPSVGNYPRLQELRLNNSKFSGSIPNLRGLADTLATLDLSNNGDSRPGTGFSGTLSAAQLHQLTRLTTLDLSGNNFSGSIPARLGELTSVHSFRIGNNGFSGSIPRELGNLRRVREFELNDNTFSGRIPSELGNLGQVRKLALNDNGLSGSIPEELGNLNLLEELLLHSNNLSGDIPASFDKLADAPSLRRVTLAGNRLTGCIPFRLFAKQNLQFDDHGLPHCPSPDRDTLVALYNATGGANWTNKSGWNGDTPIGEWYGVTTNDANRVTRLDLDGNNLVGELPVALGDLAGTLTTLNLGGNPRLSGCVHEALRGISMDNHGLRSCAPLATLTLNPDFISENGGRSTVTATLEYVARADVTLTVSVGAGATISGNKVLTVRRGQTASTGRVAITAIDDNEDSPHKKVTVSAVASGTSGVPNPADATLTITDNDGPPTVTLALTSRSINEDGGGNNVSASLSHPSSEPTTVTITPAIGHYTVGTPSTLTIPAGALRSTGRGVPILAVDDRIDNVPDRTVNVTGTPANNQGVVRTATPAKLTLIDNEDTPTVSLALTSASIAENGGTSRVTASLSHGSSQEVRLAISARPGSGTKTSDFRLNGSTLTIPARQTNSTGTVTVRAVDNSTDNPNRTVTISGRVTKSDVADPANIGLTITDNEGAPTVTLAVADAAIDEAGGTTRVTATLSFPSSAPTMVTVTPASKLYTVEPSATLTIPAGKRESTGDGVLITAVDDDIDNVGNRSGDVTGTAVNNQGVIRTAAPATLTVTDDEKTPTATLTLTPERIGEGDETSTVTASLSHGSSAEVTLTVSAEPGSRAEAGDFMLRGTTLTIAAGMTASTGTVAVAAIDNDVTAPFKLVTVSAAVSGSSGVANPASQTLTITDDDGAPMPSLWLDPTSISEKDGVATVTATLNQTASSEVSIVVSAAGTGYVLSPLRTLQVAAGDLISTGTVTITAVDDPVDGPDKTVTVSGRAASGGVANPDDAMLTITDDDESGLAIDSPSGREGGELVFTVTLSPPNAGEVTVQYEDAGTGSATSGTDFTPVVAGMLTFAAGETVKSFSVEVIDDEEIEPEETVVITLSSPSGGAVLATETGTGTIANDDSTIATRPGSSVTRQIDGRIVTLTVDAGVPAGVSLTLPLSLSHDVTLTVDPVDPSVSTESARFELGESVAARSLVDITVSPAIPDGGVDVCLPVLPALRTEAGQRELLLLHHDGTGWDIVTGSRDRDTEVCAIGMTAFSPLAVGFLRTVPVADLERVLAGVARTLGSDAVEVLSGRFSGGAVAGSRMTLAGHRLGFARNPTHGSVAGVWHGTPGSAREDRWREPESRTVSAHDLLTRSSFELPLTQDTGEGASTLGLWGQGSGGGFSGSPAPGLDVDGALYSGYFGMDYLPQPSLLLGVAVAHSAGTVEHARAGGIDAESELTMTSLMPYAHWRADPDFGLWVVFGAGSGDQEVRSPNIESALQSATLGSFLAAMGGEYVLTGGRGFELSAKADTFWSTVNSEGTADAPGADARASRLRLLLEGKRYWEAAGNSLLALRLNLGGRWEGGSAETGTGLEVGGGLTYSLPASGFNFEASGRGQILHPEEAFNDWGAGLRVSLDPGADGRGLSFSLAPSVGDASSNATEIYEREQLTSLATGSARRVGHLETELAYGVPLTRSNPGIVTPYGGASWSESGAVHYRLGSRLALESSLELSIEGTRSTQADPPVSHGVAARLGLRW